MRQLLVVQEAPVQLVTQAQQEHQIIQLVQPAAPVRQIIIMDLQVRKGILVLQVLQVHQVIHADPVEVILVMVVLVHPMVHFGGLVV